MRSTRNSSRADELLVRQGGAESRSKAKAMILAGDVSFGERRITKPAELLPNDATLRVREPPPYVSRGGFKLAHAVDAFQLDVAGVVAADVGASTGGFSDVLLQRGAARVYAIDVGYGQLDLRIRNDPRVVVMERANARYLERLAESVGLVVIDVSFISLELILPVVRGWLSAHGQVVALIKPQFEAGRESVGRGGVVRDGDVHQAVVTRVLRAAATIELTPFGLTRSPVTGPAGNVEFLAGFRLHQLPTSGIDQLVADVFAGS